MPHNKDSLPNTLIVATVLCLVCSTLVSVAAVGLKSIKDRNILLDRKSNILAVAGFESDQIKSAGGIDELFKSRFDARIIDLATGNDAVDQCKAAMEGAGKVLDDVVGDYDQLWASKSKKDQDWGKKNDKEPICLRLEKKADIAGIKYRENFSHVFILKSESGAVDKYVFPVRGMGLWSMMRGYLAVEPDLQTVAGLTFYEQGETPGLGGEIVNEQWKAKWTGKQIYSDGEVLLEVCKGDQTNNEYGVDALSGATITSNGVTKMIDYWMGPDGFGPFIKRQKTEAPSSASTLKASKLGGNRG